MPMPMPTPTPTPQQINGKTFLAYQNQPMDCCCAAHPMKYHFHFTLGEVLVRSNMDCDICIEFPQGYHVHYKKECCVCFK